MTTVISTIYYLLLVGFRLLENVLIVTTLYIRCAAPMHGCSPTPCNGAYTVSICVVCVHAWMSLTKLMQNMEILWFGVPYTSRYACL